MPRPKSTEPTDRELQILQVLWEEGPCTLGAVADALRRERPVATTTVATMLKVMLEKNLVRRDRGDRGYTWRARSSRRITTRGILRKVIDGAFEGSARGLVTQLIEDGQLDRTDLDEIRRLLAEHERGGKR